MDIKRQNLVEYETRSIKDYINIVRTHLIKVVLIAVFVLTLSIVYAVTAKDIFKATTILKITPPEGNILEAPLMGELGLGDRGADRSHRGLRRGHPPGRLLPGRHPGQALPHRCRRQHHRAGRLVHRHRGP